MNPKCIWCGSNLEPNTEFCGDIPRCQVNQNLPLSYKYFYDEEIKNLVYFFYKDDFVKYNFNFDF